MHRIDIAPAALDAAATHCRNAASAWRDGWGARMPSAGSAETGEDWSAAVEVARAVTEFFSAAARAVREIAESLDRCGEESDALRNDLHDLDASLAHEIVRRDRGHVGVHHGASADEQ